MTKPSSDTIPTEPIGSIPRPADLIQRIAKSDSEDPGLNRLYEDAIRDTIEQFEAAGSPVVTDGEQRKYHNFCTYCVHGLPNTAPDGSLFRSGTVIRAACRGSQVALSVTGGTPTVTWMLLCATRTCRSSRR